MQIEMEKYGAAPDFLNGQKASGKNLNVPLQAENLEFPGNVITTLTR